MGAIKLIWEILKAIAVILGIVTGSCFIYDYVTGSKIAFQLLTNFYKIF
jgi:hypothetical protein